MVITALYPHYNGLSYTVYVNKDDSEMQCYIIRFKKKVSDIVVRQVATNIFNSGIRGRDIL